MPSTMAGRTLEASRRRFPLGVRLGGSFAVILLLFATVLVVILRALDQMAAADREIAELDRAKHAGHRVAALIREQYIHQAHTIIEGNRSHIEHYHDVASVTRDATVELGRFAHSAAEHALAAEIAALVRKNHDEFLASTLPAIERGEHDAVVRLHAETELVVSGVAKRVKELNRLFEEESDAARGRAEGQRRRVRNSLLGCFSVATILAAVLGAITTRFITTRIDVLRDGARRLGDGDLSRRVHIRGDDELTDLARSVDEMAARLDTHQQALLRSQKLASMGSLCAGVAHEINGPLGIILGYAKVIRRQGADDEALNAIEEEARQCQSIVQALLDMSRHETPRFEPVDLGQLAEDGIERLRATGALGARSLDITASESPAMALGDEAKLRQVVLNVMKNAIEATPEDGHIAVEVRREKGRVVLAIVDHGSGVAADTKAKVFEPFFTTKPKGTGLGLAIARAIVEAHRGRIGIEASDNGRGARVEIDLEEARLDGTEDRS